MKVKFKKAKIRVKNKQAVNIEAILAAYQEALKKIKGPRNEPLGEGRLAQLKLQPDDPPANEGLFATVWRWIKHSPPIQVADTLELDLKSELPSTLLHAYTQEFKDHLAHLQGWRVTERGRLDAIDRAVEQPQLSEKAFESRYAVLFECCSRLVAFALSDAGWAETNPITVCEALDDFIQAVLRKDLLKKNGWHTQIRYNRRHAVAFRQYLDAPDGHRGRIELIKKAALLGLELDIPKRLLTQDVHHLQNTRLMLEKLLIIYLKAYTGRGRFSSDAPEASDILDDRVKRNLHELQEPLGTTPLEIVNTLQAIDPAWAKPIEALYRIYAKVKKQLSIAERLQCLVGQVNWPAFLSGAIRIEQYAQDLSAIWEEVAQCQTTTLQLADNPLLAHDSNEISRAVLRTWSHPDMQEWHEVQARGAVRDGVPRHCYLSQPAIKEKMRQYFATRLDTLAELSKKQPRIFH